MENAPIDRLDELEGHLKVLVETPETPLDARLFDDVELQLTQSNVLPLLPRLLPSITAILTSTPHNPAPITSLTTKLLAPLSFSTILPLAPPEALSLALSSSPPAALLALSILEKATSDPSSVAILSTHPPLIAQLITTWLSTPIVDVGERATRLLGALLDTDCPSRQPKKEPSTNGAETITYPPPRPPVPGQGLLWRRVFADQQIYTLLLTFLSSSTPTTSPHHLSEHQRSLAQARLLRLLPGLCVLDLQTLSRSPFPDVERACGAQGRGILHFAALEMVDKSDVLMHLTLLDFWAELVREMSGVEVGREGEAVLRGLVGEARAGGDQEVGGLLGAIAEEEGVTAELVELLRKLGVGEA